MRCSSKLSVMDWAGAASPLGARTRQITSVLALGLAASIASAQVTVVDSFSEIPGAVFHNIVNPSACSVHFRENIPISVGGTTITWSYYSTVRADHRYPMGCVNYSEATFDIYRVTPNQSVDPGDFLGDYTVPEDGNGDVIINFSEPLTGFGTTSILGIFTTSSRPLNADRFVAYDALNGTGAVLADVTTAEIIHRQLRLDFKGIFTPTARIRSVRYINAFPGLSIDGIAVALQPPAPTCIADFDDGSGTGTPDGGVTIDDLLYFLNIFEQGTLAADVDDGTATGTPDAGVTIDDLLYYLQRFEAGC